MQRKKPYYHLTSVSNVGSILKNGLKGGVEPRGREETLEKPSVFVLNRYHDGLFDYVAINQLWPFQDIDEYAVIEVAANGVIGKVKPDYVAERTAHFHRIIEQDVISPKYLRVARIARLDYPGGKILRIMRSHWKRKWSKTEWAIARKWFDKSLLESQEMHEQHKAKWQTSKYSKSRKLVAA